MNPELIMRAFFAYLSVKIFINTVTFQKKNRKEFDMISHNISQGTLSFIKHTCLSKNYWKCFLMYLPPIFCDAALF